MNLNCTKLSIANIGILINSELEYHLSDRCSAFVKNDISIDVVFNIHKYKSIIFDNYPKVLDENKISFYNISGQIIKVKYSDNEKRYIRWYLCERDEIPYVYDIYIKDVDSLSSVSPLYYVSLSKFLMNYNAMMLHSSLINYKGKGIVFSAPSGTGKSTQADLWKYYHQADVLNGDRTVIRFYNNSYLGYGSPYAGSSGIYRNESVPIVAIVILRQAKYNKLTKINLKEAFLYLISQMSISPLDKKVVEKQSNWIIKLAKKVPIYLLECLPNKEATDIVLKEIEDVDFYE